MALYEVTSEARFREFRKGERFEALLSPEEEARALGRGAVVVIDPAPPGLRPGSYRLPDGWSTPETNTPDPGGFSLKGAM